MRASPSLVLAVLVSTFASTADADPLNVWSRARNPAAAQEQDAIDEADRAVSRTYSISSPSRRALQLKRTLAALKDANAHKSENGELRFRLAQIYYRLFDVDADLDHIRAAKEHFEFVAAEISLPQSMRARALQSLAICEARLGDHEAEVQTYTEAIALEADPISHGVLLANQAEGFMARGRIIAAVRGYRASLRATPSPLMIDSGVTTMWGLAVALDRAGDLDKGIENVRRARSYDPGDIRINGDHWFYVPPYDVHWYKALGEWQLARDADDPLVRRATYLGALNQWQRYTELADPDDPWLPVAEFRRGQCLDEFREKMADAPPTLEPTEPKRWSGVNPTPP